ncbi:hypothetical protein [Yoonia sp. MH D7]
MRKLFLICGALYPLQACTVARTAGNVAVGTGQLALGAVDVVL